MATTTSRPRTAGTGAGGGAFSLNGGGGGGGDAWRPPRLRTGSLGMLLALAGISMLFIAITSSYVVGQGLASRAPARMPPLLPVNTLVLFAASAAIEGARRAGAAAARDRWLALALALGIAFLGGQLLVWRQLAAAGVYLGSSPHSSFFYLLTGLHGLHLLGGVAAVAFLEWRAWRGRAALSSRWLDVAALYWHFMGGLWAYLLVLLFAWR